MMVVRMPVMIMRQQVVLLSAPGFSPPALYIHMCVPVGMSTMMPMMVMMLVKMVAIRAPRLIWFLRRLTVMVLMVLQ